MITCPPAAGEETKYCYRAIHGPRLLHMYQCFRNILSNRSFKKTLTFAYGNLQATCLPSCFAECHGMGTARQWAPRSPRALQGVQPSQPTFPRTQHRFLTAQQSSLSAQHRSGQTEGCSEHETPQPHRRFASKGFARLGVRRRQGVLPPLIPLT